MLLASSISAAGCLAPAADSRYTDLFDSLGVQAEVGMAIRREFLGLEEPALHRAAQFFVDRYRTPDGVDLGDVLVVVPGSRAGRRLRELLFRQVDESMDRYVPPTITTVGQIPELLYAPQRPFASDWIQHLSWSNAIRNVDADVRNRVFPQAGQAETADWSSSEWLALGQLLHSCYRELAAEGLTFADVAERGADLPGFPESQRWNAMAVIQTQYLDRLDELNLWDRQTARLVAIDKQECHYENTIYLLAAPDLNETLRRMLTQLTCDITALVHAAPEWDERFDEIGCLRHNDWTAPEISLRPDQLSIVDRFQDQALEVVECLKAIQDRFACDQISIGCADKQLVPFLQRALAAHDLNGRWGPGRSVTESGPFRLLADVTAFLRQNQYEDIARLVRHPDIRKWLSNRDCGGYLNELDRYRQAHIPSEVTRHFLGNPKRRRQLEKVVTALQQLVSPLKNSTRELGEWAGPIREVLTDVYGQQDWSAATPANRFCSGSARALQGALNELSVVPRGLSEPIDAAEAVELLLEHVQSREIPEAADPDAIELLGWLELLLDDAPALVLTGMNEGNVPRAASADMFLPESLRQHLKIDDHEKRFARDAYAMSVLAKCDKDLQVIISRRDAGGDPQWPSRLLLADSPDIVADRWNAFLQSKEVTRNDDNVEGFASEFGFFVPHPRPLTAPIERISATAIKLYLACPYRFYLRIVLGLQPIDDTPIEMPPTLFGNVMHDVLADFGVSAVKDSTDPEAIRGMLHGRLDEVVRQKFGSDLSPALRIQLRQIQLRLEVFADKQAARRLDGWRIEYVEQPEESIAELTCAEGSIPLIGRIDRIDVNERTGEFSIWDYKTSESGDTPEKTHRETRSRRWRDVQLPLYRLIARQMGIECDRVGYVLLPSKLSEIGFVEAKWTSADFESAIRVAEKAAEGILKQEFWPPGKAVYPTFDDYSSILLSGVLERPPFES